MPLTKFRLDLPDVVLPEAGGHMTGERNAILAAAFGAQMDALAEQVFAGRLQSSPFAGGANATREGAVRASDGRLLECEPFVLPRLSFERGIALWGNEPLLSRRVRVSRWQQLRASFATDAGKLRNLQPWWLPGVLPTVRIVFQSNEGTPSSTWHTLDPAGVYSIHRSRPSNFNFDGQASKSSRWWAFIYLPPAFITDGFTWDAGPDWDSGPLWDGVIASAVGDWVGMLKEGKGAGSRCAGVWYTDLQPGDDIPGYPGRHPFDPTDTAIQDPSGWTSLPIGNWGSSVWTSGAFLGLNSRPPWATLAYLDNP